jgi:hypothetical protein
VQFGEAERIAGGDSIFAVRMAGILGTFYVCGVGFFNKNMQCFFVGIERIAA